MVVEILSLSNQSCVNFTWPAGWLAGKVAARLQLPMAASVWTPGVKIVQEEMARPAPEEHDVPDPGPPDFGASDRERKKWQAARKKFAAAEKMYDRELKTWARMRVSIAGALAHAVKDGEACRRYGLNPDKTWSQLKIPSSFDLTREAGESAATYVLAQMTQPGAQGWRARMTFKDDEGAYQHTSLSLGVSVGGNSEICSLCRVCGEYNLNPMGETYGKPAGCLVAETRRDHIQTELHKRNVRAQAALSARENVGQQKQANNSRRRDKKNKETRRVPQKDRDEVMSSATSSWDGSRPGVTAFRSKVPARKRKRLDGDNGNGGGGQAAGQFAGGDSNLGMLTRAEKRQQEVKSIVLDALKCGIHVRCIFEMDHPELLSTYLYTFAEQVEMYNAETKARHMAEVLQEGNIFTSGSVETEFDIFSSYQNFCNSIMTERELCHSSPFSSNIL